MRINVREDGPQHAAGQRSAGAYSGTRDKFSALQDRFATLESLVNMDGMLQAVDHYIQLLQGCNDDVSKFNASLRFFTCDIKQFNI